MALRQIQVTVPKEKGEEIFEWAKDLRLANITVRTNPWLRARGKLPKVALIAALHKLLLAIYSVAIRRRPFVPHLTVQGVQV